MGTESVSMHSSHWLASRRLLRTVWLLHILQRLWQTLFVSLGKRQAGQADRDAQDSKNQQRQGRPRIPKVKDERGKNSANAS